MPWAPWKRIIYFSLANTCERDGLSLAMATSSRMTRKAVVAGLASTKIHYNLLVYSKSVNSIVAGGKTGTVFDHLVASGRGASS